VAGKLKIPWCSITGEDWLRRHHPGRDDDDIAADACPYRKPKTADRERESADTRSRWAIFAG
jgi:hypothetical protein